MKKRIGIALLFVALSHMVSLNAETQQTTTEIAMPDIEFSSNPIHGLFNFVQGIAGGPGGTSRSLTDIFNSSDYNNAEYQAIIDTYRQVNLSYDYAFSEEVRHRHNKRQVIELLIMASTQAKDVDDFAQRIMGILTNADLMTIVHTLKAFEPVYRELVWEPAQERFQTDLAKLTVRAKEVDFASKFQQASTFYNANWKADLPFKVIVAPIPVREGFTTATPQGNVISLITTYFDDPDEMLAIVFHELAHLLYANQPIEFQANLEKNFLEHDSFHKAYGYQLLNESLATAIGNGWFYKETKGQLDTRDWYHSPFINQQGQSIYPLLAEYLEQGKAIDENFVGKYLKQYAKNFPSGYLDPNSFLSNVSFLATEGFKDHNKLFQMFFEQQSSVRSLGVHTPFFEKESMDKFNSGIDTKMIIITEDNEKTLSEFKKHYAWLKQVTLPRGEFVLHHLNPDGTMLIIVSLDKLDNFGSALEALKAKKLLSKNTEVINF